MDALKQHWRNLSDQEREAFAAGSGSTVYHVRNCINGSKAMGPKLAVGIELHSGGRFKAEAMLPHKTVFRKKTGQPWPHPKGKPLIDVLPA